MLAMTYKSVWRFLKFRPCAYAFWTTVQEAPERHRNDAQQPPKNLQVVRD